VSRFVISGGGTGGHLSPAIAAAEGLIARGHEAVLLISQKKVDSRLSEKYPQLRFERMPGRGFAWQPWHLIRFALSQLHALYFCLRLMRRHRPDGVIGFGGFTSAPLVIAAWMRGVPAALHESNRVPGRAIRTLGRLADRVYLPLGISLPAIPAAATRHVGLPVRREIVRQPQAAARAALGLDPQHRLLVVFGGSQGASVLNDWVRKHFEYFASEGIQVYCVTGLGKGRDGVVELTTRTGAPIRTQFAQFCDNVGELLSAADLVVSRAGAGTLAELIRCEAPAVLVPYPQAADDHQRANAAFFERQGGGLVVEQSRMENLHTEIVEIIGNDWLLRKFRGNLQRMDRANALELMLRDLETIARDSGSSSSAARVLTV
jgi:UDP-N-acetylglucosamine--N-acetylmuramyl-(pentapeptide) pyrophosphoryl-undecaprenol N-acetylglucosamine transferase